MTHQFESSKRSFSAVNARYLARCAALAYKSAEEIRAALEEDGFSLGKDFFFQNEASDAQGFIIGDQEKIIISFRGSEQKLSDWLTNTNLTKLDFPDEKNPIGKVHRGFFDALNSVWGSVEMQLNKLRDKNQGVWITGHSMGGALALLAGAVLRFQISPSLSANGIYTFGQPRVGDNTFAEAFNIVMDHRCFRLVNNKDVVTRVPPQLFGFRHVGKIRHFDARQQMHEDLELWHNFWEEKDSAYDDARELVPDLIADHSIAEYEKLACLCADGGLTAGINT